MSDLRNTIVSEIQRLAFANDGRAPGQRAFVRETGIRENEWLGVIWARWGDALVDAGFAPNQMQGRTEVAELFERLVDAVRHYGRIPTKAELQLRRAQDPTFPSHKTFSAHFGSKENLVREFRNWLVESGDPSGLLSSLPAEESSVAPRTGRTATAMPEGYVYLLQSGRHFKIGRSDELEKRVKQISIALPETVKLAHAIRTDDPPGIEAYWHRRFADRRANGEWFKLEPADVIAFKKRKFQ